MDHNISVHSIKTLHFNKARFFFPPIIEYWHLLHQVLLSYVLKYPVSVWGQKLNAAVTDTMYKHDVKSSLFNVLKRISQDYYFS